MDVAQANIPAAIQRWRTLRTGGTYDFSEYASFLMRYPGWPDEGDMRRNAEQMLDPGSYSPSQTVAFFDRFPPTTNGGRAKFALALAATGLQDRALEMARQAWRGGALGPDVEARINGLASGRITAEDQDARMDALLWSGAVRDAGRQIGYVSGDRRASFAARLEYIAGRDGGPGAPDAMRDAGYVASHAGYLRRSGNSWAARELLAGRPPLTYFPADVEAWFEILLTNARAAQADGQSRLAYQIASKIDDALPAGTVISAQPLGVRDDYTSLAWLAGRVALENLGQPADAARMFELYGRGAKSPQTVTKGLYWAARAARRAGNAVKADALLGEAAVYYDSFYGQLAREALGQPPPTPVVDPKILTNLGRPADNPLYMAASIAGQYGNHQEQTLFLRAIANGAKSAEEHLGAIALSKYIGRPDLTVMAGRNARIEGHDAAIAWAFPTVALPSGLEQNFTLIHAISRQESQFDRAAVSHAGARGLMQLMPGTARETAGKIGLPYMPGALTTDTDYNIRLGSTYIDRMLAYYNYSYPLAIAAYNAGPGNVNRWIAQNGDPRMAGADMIDWIENIPLFETRNYVQRVLENAVMYDSLNASRARVRTPNPLGVYLGIRSPR